MVGGPDKVDGVEDARGEREKWSAWLIPGGKKEYDKISSPALKTLVRSLARRPDELTPAEKLSEFYDQFEKLELVLKGPSKQQALEYMDRIAGKAHGLTEEFPTSLVEQRKLLVRLVEEIEGTELPLGPVQGVGITDKHLNLAKRASRLLEKIGPGELKSEAQARLRLHHCYAIASAIPGNGEAAKLYLSGAFLQPESKKWVLQPDDFDVIMRGKIRGLDTARAFEVLQRASTEGLRIGTRTIKLSEGLSNEDRSSVIRQIKRQIGGTEDSASKALQLAQRMAKATFETSVWNTDLKGNDPYAEAIYLQKYRNSRLSSAKDRGPEITISRIFSIGTSYFRGAQTFRESGIARSGGGQEDQYLFLSSDADHPAQLTRNNDPQTRINAMLKRGTAQEPLNISRMDFGKLKPGDYAGWLAGKVPQILDLKSVLLKSSWEPKELTTDAIEDFIGKFDAADPGQVMRLRTEFTLGIFWTILRNSSNAATLGWSASRIHDLRRNLTALFESERGLVPAFLTKDQMDWITNKALPAYKVSFDHSAALIDVYRNISKRGIEI